MNRSRVLVVLILAVGALLVGCTDPDDDETGDTTPDSVLNDEVDEEPSDFGEGTPVPGGSLVLALNAEPGNLNPVTAQAPLQGHFAMSAIYDPLGFVGQDGRVVPLLATSIEPDETAELWTIGIPEGITFHDGTSLTAEVVAANLQTRRDGPTGNIQLTPMGAAHAVDARTVEVTMTEPWAAFDHVLTQQPGYVVSQSMLDGQDVFVGTGPFRFVDQTVDVATRLEANRDYWRTDDDGLPLPYLDELELRVIPDPTARENALDTGSVDAIFSISVQAIDQFRQDPDFEVVLDADGDETLIVLNAARPPLDDPRIREAAIRSVDRAAVNDAVFDGLLDIAGGFFAEDNPWYDPDTSYPETDVDRARTLVDEWTAETGETPSFTLFIVTGPEAADTSTVLREMWADVGLDVDIDVAEQGTFIQNVVFGQVDSALMNNFGYADPDFHYIFLHSANAFQPGEGIGTNFTYTINPDLDAAMELGRSSTDPAERLEAYSDATRVFNEEFSAIFINHRVVVLIGRPEVNGFAAAEEFGFGGTESKPWLAELWRDPEG